MKKRNRRCGLGVKGNEFHQVGDTVYLAAKKRDGSIRGYILIDAEDLEKVQGHTWNILPIGYAYTNTHEGRGKSKTLYLHRVLLNAQPDQEVDHINRVRHDCRKANLRICTRSQNVANGSMRRKNTSGITGVSEIRHQKRDKRWHAYIDLPNGKRKSKMFATREEALEQRKAWEVEHNNTGLHKQEDQE